MKRKLLAVVPTVALVATTLGMGAPITHASSKDTQSQKIEAKAETRPTLRKGSRSSYVRDLQQSLKDVKYDTGVDGIFGTQTQNRVREFQVDHNLYSDGIVGPLTWAALDENKVERTQFTVNDAITFGKKKLGNNIVFGGDGRLLKDDQKQSYYSLRAANKDWMDQGGTGTIGWFHIYKDGRVVEE
ncbi:peptidoglycan-binding domain-containing protein [Priestia megaterium]|uniref:peptidoglycan-binding domain-containing protein n=1 Tax=Priestia megaterium TaxID=1404 RepID=UPI0024530548|nr:peptidoglycan-binding domain-containing protein [Priestia megaterium]MDH3139093.1 peptidoglycan-binding domain-containing protein [Priestia megaterium]MED4268149.1 peptidoglycan-binding domain-containing protein [Priestia megaterium]MED4279555.1 peptidoglycan-binding domain-containing protein [Priestia megaterium]MED4318690.1 peptidoglycan-binding domain-containing protein [Priestia megaterium]